MKTTLFTHSTLALLLAVALLSACGKENPAPAGGAPGSGGNGAGGNEQAPVVAKPGAIPGPGGTWWAERKSDDRTERARITFEPARLLINTICTYNDGQVISIKAISPVNYSTEGFVIETRVREAKTEKGKTCATGIDKGEYSYKVAAGKMTVKAKGERDCLELAKE